MADPLPTGIDSRIDASLKEIGFEKSADQPRAINRHYEDKPHIFVREYDSGGFRYFVVITTTDIDTHGEADVLSRIVSGAQRARGY